MCARGHVYVCQGSCICVLEVMYMCVRRHVYVCQGSCICVLGVVRQGSCICVLGVMYMCVRGRVLGVMYMCARGHVYVCQWYWFCLCFYVVFSLDFEEIPTVCYFLAQIFKMFRQCVILQLRFLRYSDSVLFFSFDNLLHVIISFQKIQSHQIM